MTELGKMSCYWGGGRDRSTTLKCRECWIHNAEIGRDKTIYMWALRFSPTRLFKMNSTCFVHIQNIFIAKVLLS